LSVYQRGKIWWIDYYYRGRRHRESVSGSRKDAVKALEARKGDIVRGRFELQAKKASVTFEEFATEYLKHLQADRRWWRREVSRLRILVKFFGRSFLEEITPFDVERYKADRRKTVTGPGVNRELALLKAMLNKAVLWGFARLENPVSKVAYYPERTMERILAEGEAERLLAACGESLRPVVLVALNTGMRKSEILSLRWRDVDFARRFIRVERSKNNRSRRVPMNSAVLDELKRLKAKAKSECVFTQLRSPEVGLRCIRSAFLRACRKAGISELRFHDLRHTFATNLVMSGTDLVTLKEILGHSDISMTVRYSHPSDGRKMGAVERLVHEGWVAEDGKNGHNLVTIQQAF